MARNKKEHYRKRVQEAAKTISELEEQRERYEGIITRADGKGAKTVIEISTKLEGNTGVWANTKLTLEGAYTQGMLEAMAGAAIKAIGDINAQIRVLERSMLDDTASMMVATVDEVLDDN